MKHNEPEKINRLKAKEIRQNIDQAMNDWPEKVENYNDFIEKIKISLRINTVDKISIVKFMETNNPLKFAWVFESLESILSIKELEQSNLEEIVNSLDQAE